MGAYVVRTSSLNDKHSCPLFRMGLRGKNHTHIDYTFNQGCAIATIFSILAFLSSSVSMANLSRLVAASFSSLALLSFSVSMANLSCLLAPVSSLQSFDSVMCCVVWCCSVWNCIILYYIIYCIMFYIIS